MNEQNRPSMPQGSPTPTPTPTPATLPVPQPVAPEPQGQALGAGQSTTAGQPPAPGPGSSWAWSQSDGPQPLGVQPSAGWGAPPSGGQQPGVPQPGQPQRWTMKRTLIVAGVAVVVAAGTAAGFYSLGSAGSADAANVPLDQTGAGGLGGQQGQVAPGQGNGLGQAPPGQMGGMAPDGLGMAGGLSAAIHSEYVILREQQYVTMVDQLGVVAEISSDSVTLKSEDGFTRTYALTDDTTVAQGSRQRSGTPATTLSLADVKAGSTIRVTAAKNGDTYTAESIRLTSTTTSGQGSTSGLGAAS
ncbi:hypothetical protein ACIQC5_16780 [Paenarthrobacter sp. NPDC092416]|uniref:hypothetical protein n=1 Tax=Paenarthrobacter sp. NPDC092416 TaxID=3364386 RepID=UPI0038202F9A